MPSGHSSSALRLLDDEIVECRRCPRLVAWREQVARERRAAFADEEYWGRPVPAFGSTRPRVLIVGLAPAAHGANRTGRMFTGDRSGDWLFGSLHRVGLATSPTSTARGDGQSTPLVRITAAVHCAPPGNAPSREEQATCATWLDAELRACLPTLAVIVALGGIAWSAALASAARVGLPVPRPKPRFGHAVRAEMGDVALLGSYHPSQQNTFTGRLTAPMLDIVLADAAALAG